MSVARFAGSDSALSTPIVVNESYAETVTTHSSTVFPCQQSLQVVVDRPPTAHLDRTGIRDVIRLYVRQYPAEGTWPTHVATTQLVYVTERVLTANDSRQFVASFDCQVFDDFDDVTVIGFCFQHTRVDDVTRKVSGNAELCVPSRASRGESE